MPLLLQKPHHLYKMSIESQLRGTGVALVTPFKQNQEVDYGALGQLIDRLIAEGVEYLVTLGTTGEVPTLSKDEKYAVADFTFDRVNGRVPVVLGVGGNNTQEVIAEIKRLPADRAVAILSASPYYNKPSQEGLYQHYKAIAASTDRPVILYNVPGRTGRNVTAATVLRLANDCPNIVGIKEAGGDLVQCMHLLKGRPEGFMVVSGDDHLCLSQIACGMTGVISVAANSFPGAFSEMVRAALAGDLEKARRIHYSLLDAYDLLFEENSPAGVKAFLAAMGQIENVLRLPVTPVNADLEQRIRKFAEAFAGATA